MSIGGADQHDLDKLARWHQDLSIGDQGHFPLYCVFLVSPDHRASHQVFRGFRASFEKRYAGFQHLVIFGQHGISTTLRALLAEFGLTLEQVPALVLVGAPEFSIACMLQLASGDQAKDVGGTEYWQTVLGLVEGIVDRHEKVVDFGEIAEMISCPLDNGPLPDVVDRVFARLS